MLAAMTAMMVRSFLSSRKSNFVFRNTAPTFPGTSNVLSKDLLEGSTVLNDKSVDSVKARCTKGLHHEIDRACGSVDVIGGEKLDRLAVCCVPRMSGPTKKHCLAVSHFSFLMVKTS
jgi:hypothetical protein